MSGVTSVKLLEIADLNATGSSLADLLIGNRGNDGLDGGAGADIMRGAFGDDSYLVDNAGDQSSAKPLVRAPML